MDLDLLLLTDEELVSVKKALLQVPMSTKAFVTEAVRRLATEILAEQPNPALAALRERPVRWAAPEETVIPVEE